MATVHLGRLLGSGEVGRTVAVKRLHAHFTTDHDFATMFMDEARIVARIRHSNVVSMVDVIESRTASFIVMEYIHGEALSKLLRTCRSKGVLIPIPLAARIMHDVLLGLHAAHERKARTAAFSTSFHETCLRRTSMVGADGVARVLDFGVAKAAGRAQVTREGQIKGKLTYMSPEQIRGKVDRRADVFAAAVVLWERSCGAVFTRAQGHRDRHPRRERETSRAELGPCRDLARARGGRHEGPRSGSRRRVGRMRTRWRSRSSGRSTLATRPKSAEWVVRIAADVLAGASGESHRHGEARGVALPLRICTAAKRGRRRRLEETVSSSRSEPVEHTVLMPAAKSSTNLRASARFDEGRTRLTTRPPPGCSRRKTAALEGPAYSRRRERPGCSPRGWRGRLSSGRAASSGPLGSEPTSPALIASSASASRSSSSGALMLAWSASCADVDQRGTRVRFRVTSVSSWSWRIGNEGS
jgi:hypothetical protein